jgi:DNA repair photolyase
MHREVGRGRRGTLLNPTGRFQALVIEPDPEMAANSGDAGLASPGAAGDPDRGQAPPIPTQYFRDSSRSLITHNDSPDVPFTHSINVYRGCEHGCIYCYARPYHEYLGLSAGLDFETKIFVKERAPELLRSELARPSWKGEALAMSGVTDAYQPVERRLQLTRRCLEVMAECRQPVGLITKSALVARDVDVLGELARHGAVHAWLTLTTLDEGLRRISEPRAATADARLDAVSRLAERQVPAGVIISPVIPGLTDHEIPAILERARQAGASFAAFTMLRLPHGVAALFETWLEEHLPARKEKVLGRLRQLRGGCLTDSRFGHRMSGEGAFADVTAQLFHMARERAGLAEHSPPLSSAAFRRPGRVLPLFEDGMIREQGDN